MCGNVQQLQNKDAKNCGPKICCCSFGMGPGNLYAGTLQIEPTATFNGQCHMGANIVEMNNNEQQAAAK